MARGTIALWPRCRLSALRRVIPVGEENMERKIAGLLGAMAALGAFNAAEAAPMPSPAPSDVLRANSFAELLDPIPNAAALLQAVDESGSASSADENVQLAQYHHSSPPPSSWLAPVWARLGGASPSALSSPPPSSSPSLLLINATILIALDWAKRQGRRLCLFAVYAFCCLRLAAFFLRRTMKMPIGPVEYDIGR